MKYIVLHKNEKSNNNHNSAYIDDTAEGLCPKADAEKMKNIYIKTISLIVVIAFSITSVCYGYSLDALRPVSSKNIVISTDGSQETPKHRKGNSNPNAEAFGSSVASTPKVFLTFIGPPQAGKSREARALAKALNLLIISTGEILRDFVKDNPDNPLAIQIDKKIKKGVLVEDRIVLEVIRNKLPEYRRYNGVIFDGYPRNKEQAQALDNLLEEEGFLLNKAIFFKMSFKSLMKKRKKRIKLVKGGKRKARPDRDEEINYLGRYIDYILWIRPELEAYYASRKLEVNLDKENFEHRTVYEIIKEILPEKFEKYRGFKKDLFIRAIKYMIRGGGRDSRYARKIMLQLAKEGRKKIKVEDIATFLRKVILDAIEESKAAGNERAARWYGHIKQVPEELDALIQNPQEFFKRHKLQDGPQSIFIEAKERIRYGLLNFDLKETILEIKEFLWRKPCQKRMQKQDPKARIIEIIEEFKRNEGDLRILKLTAPIHDIGRFSSRQFAPGRDWKAPSKPRKADESGRPDERLHIVLLIGEGFRQAARFLTRIACIRDEKTGVVKPKYQLFAPIFRLRIILRTMARFFSQKSGTSHATKGSLAAKLILRALKHKRRETLIVAALIENHPIYSRKLEGWKDERRMFRSIDRLMNQLGIEGKEERAKFRGKFIKMLIVLILSDVAVSMYKYPTNHMLNVLFGLLDTSENESSIVSKKVLKPSPSEERQDGLYSNSYTFQEVIGIFNKKKIKQPLLLKNPPTKEELKLLIKLHYEVVVFRLVEGNKWMIVRGKRRKIVDVKIGEKSIEELNKEGKIDKTIHNMHRALPTAYDLYTNMISGRKWDYIVTEKNNLVRYHMPSINPVTQEQWHPKLEDFLDIVDFFIEENKPGFFTDKSWPLVLNALEAKWETIPWENVTQEIIEESDYSKLSNNPSLPEDSINNVRADQDFDPFGSITPEQKKDTIWNLIVEGRRRNLKPEIVARDMLQSTMLARPIDVLKAIAGEILHEADPKHKAHEFALAVCSRILQNDFIIRKMDLTDYDNLNFILRRMYVELGRFPLEEEFKRPVLRALFNRYANFVEAKKAFFENNLNWLIGSIAENMSIRQIDIARKICRETRAVLKRKRLKKLESVLDNLDKLIKQEGRFLRDISFFKSELRRFVKGKNAKFDVNDGWKELNAGYADIVISIGQIADEAQGTYLLITSAIIMLKTGIIHQLKEELPELKEDVESARADIVEEDKKGGNGYFSRNQAITLIEVIFAVLGVFLPIVVIIPIPAVRKFLEDLILANADLVKMSKICSVLLSGLLFAGMMKEDDQAEESGLIEEKEEKIEQTVINRLKVLLAAIESVKRGTTKYFKAIRECLFFICDNRQLKRLVSSRSGYIIKSMGQIKRLLANRSAAGIVEALEGWIAAARTIVDESTKGPAIKRYTISEEADKAYEEDDYDKILQQIKISTRRLILDKNNNDVTYGNIGKYFTKDGKVLPRLNPHLALRHLGFLPVFSGKDIVRILDLSAVEKVEYIPPATKKTSPALRLITRRPFSTPFYERAVNFIFIFLLDKNKEVVLDEEEYKKYEDEANHEELFDEKIGGGFTIVSGFDYCLPNKEAILKCLKMLFKDKDIIDEAFARLKKGLEARLETLVNILKGVEEQEKEIDRLIEEKQLDEAKKALDGATEILKTKELGQMKEGDILKIKEAKELIAQLANEENRKALTEQLNNAYEQRLSTMIELDKIIAQAEEKVNEAIKAITEARVNSRFEELPQVNEARKAIRQIEQSDKKELLAEEKELLLAKLRDCLNGKKQTRHRFNTLMPQIEKARDFEKIERRIDGLTLLCKKDKDEILDKLKKRKDLLAKERGEEAVEPEAPVKEKEEPFEKKLKALTRDFDAWVKDVKSTHRTIQGIKAPDAEQRELWEELRDRLKELIGRCYKLREKYRKGSQRKEIRLLIEGIDKEVIGVVSTNVYHSYFSKILSEAKKIARSAGLLETGKEPSTGFGNLHGFGWEPIGGMMPVIAEPENSHVLSRIELSLSKTPAAEASTIAEVDISPANHMIDELIQKKSAESDLETAA